MAAASSNARTRLRSARPLLGTFVEIEAEAAPGAALEAAIDAAFADVAEVHRLMSFHEPDSDVGRLNREAQLGPVAVHGWTYRVLEAALALNRRSDGAFNIGIAPVLQARGLLPRFDGETVIAGAAPGDAIELLADHCVRFRSPDVRIDLGGIAKGFAVDRACAALRRFGVARGLVNAGGDLFALGDVPQTVHIRDPRDPRRVLCAMSLANEALASTARRFDPLLSEAPGESAIIMPANAKPAEMLAGVTVRAPSCMMADALTKIVMIMGTDAGDLLAAHGAGALLVSPGGEVQVTPNLSEAIDRAA